VSALANDWISRLRQLCQLAVDRVERVLTPLGLMLSELGFRSEL